MATTRGGAEYDTGSRTPSLPQPSPPPSSPTANNLLLDPSGYGGDAAAANMTAALYRAQWQDYLTRFAPLETELRDSILSGERMDTALGRVNPAVEQQFGLAKQGAQQRMQRYGLTPTAEVQTEQDNSYQRSMAGTEAALRNRVRQSVRDTNMDLIAGSGSIPNRQEEQ